MPNQPKFPGSYFRIPPDVKTAAQARARAEGRTLTDVIVTALTKYGARRPRD